VQFQVDSDVVSIATGVRSGVADLANENGRCGSAAQVEAGKLDVMLESGRTVPGGLRLRHPQLGQVYRAGSEMFLGVHHPVTGSHQIEFLRPDRLLAPEAVAVKKFAGQHPGDRLEPDMGMRSNPDPAACTANGCGVIEEAPGADGSPASLGQGAPDLHVAHVGPPAFHDLEIGDRVSGSGHWISVEGCERSAHRDDLLVRDCARSIIPPGAKRADGGAWAGLVQARNKEVLDLKLT
jgi:hypothetical protein